MSEDRIVRSLNEISLSDNIAEDDYKVNEDYFTNKVGLSKLETDDFQVMTVTMKLTWLMFQDYLLSEIRWTPQVI